MHQDLEISLLGELRVACSGRQLELPTSRKARALLAFLVATERPHRRERLCELFWEVPDDPKASLRWALCKLRKVVDAPGRARIVADRERVRFDFDGVNIDIRDVLARSKGAERRSGQELEFMVRRLDSIVLDGLDGAGDATFDAWLTGLREDVRAARAAVLRELTTHPDIEPIARQIWARRWRDTDPVGADAQALAKSPAANQANAVAPTKLDGGTRAASDCNAPQVASSEPADAANILQGQRIGFCKTRDGTKIAYASVGLGPPFLKAANWLNHLEFDKGSPIWGRSFAEFARNRTFIRYDERGCGLSDWDVSDLSFDAFVEDLEMVVDKLELERFPLLGVSQGCAVSIEYAVRHPERVSGLVLIGGYAAGWRHLASSDEQARREAVMRLTELGWGSDNRAYRHIFSQTFMPDASPEDLAWFDEFQRQTCSPANAVRFQEAFGLIDVRHRLAQVTVPTIVLHSKYDQRIPLDLGRAVASGIPNAQFVPLESRNHILVGDEPAWRVCFEAIGQFLAENGI